LKEHTKQRYEHKYKEDELVNISKSHENYQTNMNLKIKIAANVVKDSEQVKAVTQKRRHTAHKSKIRKVLKEKMGKQSNAWTVYCKYRHTAY
jgi:hypothetical protein